MSQSLSGPELYAFQTITDFVSSLVDMFDSNKHVHVKALQLYNRLITKTQINDKKVIQRHLEVFRKFCVENRNNFITYELNPEKVVFSERIYIHVEYFMKHADEDTQKTIMEYILTISAILDPSGKAKELLQTTPNVEPEPEPDIVSQMAPMMNQMLSNPAFGSMLSTFTGGNNIDFGKLAGSMNKIIGTVAKTLEESDDPEIKNLLEMATKMKEN